MPWDKTSRAKYDHKTGRYPSDMTNAQWAVIEPLVPLPKHGGRPRTTDMREVINAIFTSQEQDVSGAYYHNPFRHGQLYKDIFTSGPRRVYWPK